MFLNFYWKSYFKRKKKKKKNKKTKICSLFIRQSQKVKNICSKNIFSKIICPFL